MLEITCIYWLWFFIFLNFNFNGLVFKIVWFFFFLNQSKNQLNDFFLSVTVLGGSSFVTTVCPLHCKTQLDNIFCVSAFFPPQSRGLGKIFFFNYIIWKQKTILNFVYLQILR